MTNYLRKLESNIFLVGIKTPLGETYVPDGLSEADFLAMLLQHMFSVPKGEGLMYALPHQSKPRLIGRPKRIAGILRYSADPGLNLSS
jgi:hypothetical protein